MGASERAKQNANKVPGRKDGGAVRSEDGGAVCFKETAVLAKNAVSGGLQKSKKMNNLYNDGILGGAKQNANKMPGGEKGGSSYSGEVAVSRKNAVSGGSQKKEKMKTS